MWLTNLFQSIMNQLAVVRITDLIDILVVSYLVYKALKFIRDTKTVQLLKGIILMVVITQVSALAHLNTLHYILSNVLQLGLIAWLIVFQPELRRLLEHLGRSTVGKWFNSKGEFDENVMQMIREIAHGTQALANSRTGALIVIENNVPLGEYERTGITLDAQVSSQLLLNIFEHNTPLHDGAIIVRGNRVISATCYLPLSDNMTLSKELGTRHRAAVGISEVSDAMTVVVSEETGAISITQYSEIKRHVSPEVLREQLQTLQNKTTDGKRFRLWKGREKDESKDQPNG